MRICVISGDGIGREVIPAAVAVLRTTGLPLELREAEAGWECFQRSGMALPEETLAVAREADAVLFGAVASPNHPVPGYRSPIVALRKALDLFANIRPVVGRSAMGAPVDLVVVRENTEGFYAGRERVEDHGDTAIAERVITRRASERIVRVAFELAKTRMGTHPLSVERFFGQETLNAQRLPPRVTIVHKANVLRETCGLFRSVAFDVAREFPDVAADELLVDTCALQLATHPERFDVIVTTNLFGDILSDVACAWGGGLGLAASANLGASHALFEPVHGAAPDIAGTGIANPLAAIGCVALLLEHLGQADKETSGQGNKETSNPEGDALIWAERIRVAIQQIIAEGPHTPDLGGHATTQQVTDTFIHHIRANAT